MNLRLGSPLPCPMRGRHAALTAYFASTLGAPALINGDRSGTSQMVYTIRLF